MNESQHHKGNKLDINTIDRHLPILMLLATFLLSLFIFESWWVKIVNRFWVHPIMSKLVNHEICVACTFVILVTAHYISLFNRIERYSISRLLLAALFVLIYFIAFFSNNWIYSSIIKDCKILAWANITLLPCIFEAALALKFLILYIKREKEGSIRTNPDLEVEKPECFIDSLQRKEAFDSILRILSKSFDDCHSFTIGITSAWGSGKTTMIKYLSNKLRESGKVKTIIEFTPWKYDSSEAILKAFFFQLEKELKKYILDLSFLFDEYVAMLIDKKVWTYVRLYNYWRGYDNNAYQKISKKLSASKHNTVVFIDDLDRLDAEEILTVLKLVRNTADFPYIQFVVAYDKQYIIDSLEIKSIKGADKYLEKIFNVELTLPKYEERIICEELSNRIEKIVNSAWCQSKNTERVKNMILEKGGKDDDYTLFIPTILSTMRDVIRFKNSFYMTVSMYCDANIQDEIDYRDLFYIELLRYVSLETYEHLKNSPLTLLKSDGENLIIKQPKPENNEQKSDNRIRKLLELLFGNNSYFPNSICRKRSYNKYFMYRLDKKILTQMELLNLSNSNDADLLNNAESLYSDKYQEEFEKQISETLNNIWDDSVDYKILYRIIRILSFSKLSSLRNEISNVCISHLSNFREMTIDQFKEFICLFDCIDFNLVDSKKFDINEFFRTLLIETRLVQKVNYHNQGNIKIIKNFLINTRWPFQISDSINRIIIDTDDLGMFIMSSMSLRKIQVKYFLKYKEKLSETGYGLFIRCIKINRRNFGHTTLCEGALNGMRQYIREHPAEYFNVFVNIKELAEPGPVVVSPETYWEDIFGNRNKFESFLSRNRDIPGWMKINNFWELYKYNGYNAIRFKDAADIKKIVENGFQEEKAQLTELLNLRTLIHNKKNMTDDMLKQIRRNPLNIKLKYDLYNKLNELIATK